MNKVISFFNEVRGAGRVTCRTQDFIKLIFYTILYHLGNRVSFLNTKKCRKILLLLNRNSFTIIFRQERGDIFTFYEVIVRDAYKIPPGFLKDVTTIVDLGAHIGLASLYFQSLFPKAQVFAVEPALPNFEVLKRNCEINNYNWILLKNAIGPNKTIRRFTTNAPSNQNYLIRERNISECNKSQLIEVEIITMRDIINDFHINKIDILKIDIEGAEGELFNECKSWISFVNLIIIEVHPALVDYERIIRTITDNGFVYNKSEISSPFYDIFYRP